MSVINLWNYDKNNQIQKSGASSLRQDKNLFEDIEPEIINELLEDNLQVGIDSNARLMLEKAMEIDSYKIVIMLQELLLRAIKNDFHRLAYNTLVVLTQLPYEKLGASATFMALAATRSKYLDIQEMGIRCFEDWESKEACEVLLQCRFAEKWLQEYADQVYVDIVKEGDTSVLFEKNRAWQVAGNGKPTGSHAS